MSENKKKVNWNLVGKVALAVLTVLVGGAASTSR